MKQKGRIQTKLKKSNKQTKVFLNTTPLLFTKKPTNIILSNVILFSFYFILSKERKKKKKKEEKNGYRIRL